MNSQHNWENVVVLEHSNNLTEDYKRLLLDGQISVLVLRNVLPQFLLEKLIKQVEQGRNNVHTSHYHNGALTTYGPYLARHLDNPLEYFSKYNEIKNKLPEAADQIANVAYEEIRQVLALESMSVAHHNEHQTYSPYILRIHANGVANPLHNDMIMRDAKGSGLLVEHLNSQLSCVICIQECAEGGNLKHYNKLWDPKSEQFKIQDGLGYYPDVVAGHKECTYKPQQGDIYLLNPTYFHEIDRVTGDDRITLGFFFGFNDEAEKQAVIWS
ncbi:hypothetical protein J8M21_13340 [Pseudoalteromonas luteoviolacea]|uniref:2OG-Fe(II)-dependent halogenase WelO5 family protein n=1 Tax=Pseudoalteromonas luteoviolacea TaxID=43657 RepID=UPI001B3A5402|nr:hypothetical protein [Pseudoalteromonas luteoviolacea]MBQ4878191.1 hypothetical protein [Pseudoalteromonas luteoviolacea]MBQ4907346.1 hypothetical protein [Pseudoalteromonas luteoviolacea]